MSDMAEPFDAAPKRYLEARHRRERLPEAQKLERGCAVLGNQEPFAKFIGQAGFMTTRRRIVSKRRVDEIDVSLEGNVGTRFHLGERGRVANSASPPPKVGSTADTQSDVPRYQSFSTNAPGSQDSRRHRSGLMSRGTLR
jgi:hypothetical protein